MQARICLFLICRNGSPLLCCALYLCAPLQLLGSTTLTISGSASRVYLLGSPTGFGVLHPREANSSLHRNDLAAPTNSMCGFICDPQTTPHPSEVLNATYLCAVISAPPKGPGSTAPGVALDDVLPYGWSAVSTLASRRDRFSSSQSRLVLAHFGIWPPGAVASLTLTVVTPTESRSTLKNALLAVASMPGESQTRWTISPLLFLPESTRSPPLPLPVNDMSLRCRSAPGYSPPWVRDGGSERRIQSRRLTLQNAYVQPDDKTSRNPGRLALS